LGTAGWRRQDAKNGGGSINNFNDKDRGSDREVVRCGAIVAGEQGGPGAVFGLVRRAAFASGGCIRAETFVRTFS